MNKALIILELIIVSILMITIIIPDWNSNPVVKDYFALLAIGEIGFDIYNRIKNKL
jgi:hypothetical protein